MVFFLNRPIHIYIYTFALFRSANEKTTVFGGTNALCPWMLVQALHAAFITSAHRCGELVNIIRQFYSRASDSKIQNKHFESVIKQVPGELATLQFLRSALMPAPNDDTHELSL